MIAAMVAGPDTFEGALCLALARWQLPVAPQQMAKLCAHFEAVIEANRAVNLTRITQPVEAAIKHYADSLSLLLWVRDRNVVVQTALDVGTGAGFPAVPLAVMRPDWAVTAIDATRKKITFLSRTAKALGLANLSCTHAHSRQWKSGRAFDLVVSRALTKLPATLQDTARHVSSHGWLVAYKTASMNPTEREAAGQTAVKSDLCAEPPYAYDLQLGDEMFHRVLCAYRREG